MAPMATSIIFGTKPMRVIGCSRRMGGAVATVTEAVMVMRREKLASVEAGFRNAVARASHFCFGGAGWIQNARIQNNVEGKPKASLTTQANARPFIGVQPVHSSIRSRYPDPDPAGEYFRTLYLLHVSMLCLALGL
eukprot:scaffold21782_cov95-Skeletonema_dohrnii-CCMP3373.AAC.1